MACCLIFCRYFTPDLLECKDRYGIFHHLSTCKKPLSQKKAKNVNRQLADHHAVPQVTALLRRMLAEVPPSTLAHIMGVRELPRLISASQQQPVDRQTGRRLTAESEYL